MLIVLYIISIIIMLANVFCVYVLMNSIKANKQVKGMNDVIEYTNTLRHNGKFIVRDKDCRSIAYLMHVALGNNEPILILDVDNKNYED